MTTSAVSIVSITLFAILYGTSADGSSQEEANCRTMGDLNREYICPTFDAIAGIPDDIVFLAFRDAKLPFLPEGAFAKFALSTLVFSTCEIGRIDPHAFTGLDQLTKMIFVGTNIHVVKASWFKGLSSLSFLVLSQNNIVYIEPDVFPLIPNLQRLLIDGNNLDCLPSQALAPLKNLTYIRIEQNPWLCTCFAELVDWMKVQRITHERSDTTEETSECMVEHLPLDRASMWPPYKVFRNLSVSESGYIGMSPARDVLSVGNNISALSLLPDNVQSIKFLNSQVSKIPGFAFLRFGNSLTSLYFRNCSIRDIHPSAFAGLPKLKELFIYDNNFSTVKSEWFRDLHSLDNLGLDHNGIHHIQPTVFPMLHKLKHLSLGHNRMQCISTNELDPLKHLKEVILAHNPWNCSCQESFRKWLHEYRIRYVISRGPCVDGQIQESDDIFEQSFERREIKITSQKDSSTHGATSLEHGHPIQAGTELFDEISTSETQRSEISEEEAKHNQNVENANNDQAERVYAKHYSDSRNDDDREIFPKYIKSRNQDQELHQVIKVSIEHSTVRLSSAGMENSYVSVGGTIWDIASMSSHAASIRFENSAIPNIFNGCFSRFGNTLRRLVFRNCKVKNIDSQAFHGLVNLEELVLSQNQIQVVKSAWFENIPHLKKLSLTQNSITKIDNSVFQFLTNLEQLEISYNQMNSIETDGLVHLKNLSTVQIGNNPWSCLCRRKLSEWLVEYKIRYDKEYFDGRIESDCAKEYQKGFEITDNKETIFVDNEISGAEEGITELRGMENSKMFQVEDNGADMNTTVARIQEPVSAYSKTKPELADGQCTFHQFNQGRESRWACRSVNISVLDQIPSSADRIDIINSHIPFVPANAFIRFSNLTRLLFYNSSIHYVNASSFSNLHNLQWLIFLNNTMQTKVKSSWFHNLNNLTKLGLVRNAITEIEPNVFKYIPNLKHLSIQENKLECIYTKSLSPMKYLQKVAIQGNPWKWRCQEDLTQFFEARNISYVKSETHEGKRFVTHLLEN